MTRIEIVQTMQSLGGDGDISIVDLVDQIPNHPYKTIRNTLARMVYYGDIDRVKRGVYRLRDAAIPACSECGKPCAANVSMNMTEQKRPPLCSTTCANAYAARNQESIV